MIVTVGWNGNIKVAIWRGHFAFFNSIHSQHGLVIDDPRTDEYHGNA